MKFADYNTLTLNGQTLSGLEIVQYCKASTQENIRQLGIFFSEWMSDRATLEVQTSGSSGAPKIISVEKAQMLQSAAMTASFFAFQPGQTALLCLPVHYIAGKMMIVRALYSGLNLYCIEPESNPLRSLPEDVIIHFAPLIPMQLADTGAVKSVRKILLGGAPVGPAQEESLQHVSADIYHGFGMTETLSHIAVRRLNGPARSEVYQALEGVVFDVDDHDCLIIDVPFLPRRVSTKDVVHLISEHEFVWRGRLDHVVNSGGVKLYPEEIEKKLNDLIAGPFFIAGLPDERFGEKLCLFIQGASPAEPAFQDLLRELAARLDRYEKPRDIFFLKEFRMTRSGKIMRNETVSTVLK